MVIGEKMISIIVPVYNAEKYIRQTIESVLNQSYEDFEVIFVDDGSDDRSADIISEVKDSRVRLLKNKSKGAYAARNYGLDEAKGRYISFLDADDIWDKDKLKKTLAFMEDNDAGFVYTAYDFGNVNGKSTGKTVHTVKKLTYEMALSRTIIFTSTVLIDLTKVDKSLVYMPNIASEDTATWWNILRAGHIAYGLDESLTIYRRSGGSLSANKKVACKRIWNLYRKQEGLGIVKSIIKTFGWGIRAVARRL